MIREDSYAVSGYGCGNKDGGGQSFMQAKPCLKDFKYIVFVMPGTPHTIGTYDAAKKTKSNEEEQAGAFVFLPYLPLAPGKYRVKFNPSAVVQGNKAFIKVSVIAFSKAKPDNPVASADVMPSAADHEFVFDFDVPLPVASKYEFRSK